MVKKGTPKRWRSKEAREVAAAVERAGGTVELTAKGHLRVSGPSGLAIVASAPDAGHQGGRALANTWATIERETGLVIAPPATPKSSSSDQTPPAPRSPVQRSHIERKGEVTRWGEGETYGFITSTDGTSWFVSRDNLPSGLPELPVGTQVCFAGSPKPRVGKPYPEAVRVRVLTDS